MRRVLLIFVSILVFSFVFFGIILAEENKMSEGKKDVTAEDKKVMGENIKGVAEGDVQPSSDKESRAMKGKEELLSIITNDLDAEEEIISYIPELKKQRDKDGNPLYTYNIDGKEVKLEEIDEEMLRKVANRVINEAVRIRTERINRQIQMQASMQSRLIMQSQQQRAVVPIQIPPRIANVTPPPAQPPQPQTPPKAPQVPPTPPRK